jgi:GT2 family glycosyltransferase
MNNNLSISVIIPVYNGGSSFRRCLMSLEKAFPKPIEIIVVADGDTDGSWQIAQQFNVKVIRREINQGPAKARNIGAKIAQGDILFFIDADVTVYPDTISQVLEIFHNQPNLAALIGSYDDAPDGNNFLSQYKNLFHHYTHQNSSEEASTFWGACGAIRRDIFLKIGGFNENYRLPSVEDIELGYRLKASGYQIKLCQDIQVKHLKRWGIISLIKTDFFCRALPWTQLILEYNRFINDLNLNWINRTSVLLVYGLLLSFCLSWWWTNAIFLIPVIVLLLLTINYSVYRFFWQKRGWLFALRVIPWHWLYYFYSGLAFIIGILRYQLTIARQIPKQE